MTKKPAASVFKKGPVSSAKSSPGAGQFVSLSPDSVITVAALVPLDEMVSCDMHEYWEVNPFVSMPCIGKGCAACATGNKPKFKAFLPVMTEDNQSKVFSFGIQIARQLEDIEEELESLAGVVIKVRRDGAGLKTRYSATSVGKKVKTLVEPIDVTKILGPVTREEQVKLLTERGLYEASADEAEEAESFGGGEDDGGFDSL